MTYNNKIMHLRFTLLALSLLIAKPVFSQTGAGNPKDPPPYVVDYRVMAWSGSVWEIYRDPQNVELFSVGSHRPSEWFRFTAPQPTPIPLFKNGETVPGEDGVEIPRPVAFLQPQSSGKWLFLLFRDKDKDGNLIYRSLAVKDESPDLKTGYLVINLSDSDLAIRMNDETVKISSQDRHHFTPKPFQDNTVDVKIAIFEGTELKLKKSNTFSMPETGLTFVFITKQGNRIWLRRFVDKDTFVEELEQP
jgi:hypothetical protein